jgi:uncharacterized protein (TIGR02246 family)
VIRFDRHQEPEGYTMRDCRFILYGASTIAALALSTLPGTAQSLEEEVSAAYASWDEAFNAKDAAAIAANYTGDAIFLPATHDVISGPSGVEEFFEAILDMGVSGHRLDLIEVREDGGVVVGAAKWSADGKDADGADQPWGGIATHVFERQDDGSLKLMLHTFN